ncbi:MAG: HAD family hydrolase [Nanoarchaeota archaeon]|nr:HAD family hydrolase [Nanoarchaeota archaeon]
MKNKLSALIIDLDGTLIDSKQNQFDWMKYCVTELFKKPFPYDSCSEEFLKDYMAAYNQGGLDAIYALFDIDANEHQDFLWEHFNPWKEKNPAPIVKDMKETIMDIYRRSRPRPGKVKGLRIALNTSNAWPSFEKQIYNHWFINYFDTIVTKDDIPDLLDKKSNKKDFLLKPNTYSIEWILDLLGADAHEALHVGDTVHDIECCRNLCRKDPSNPGEVKVVSVTWGFDTKENLKAKKPYRIISQPNQLVKIVEKLGGFD